MDTLQYVFVKGCLGGLFFLLQYIYITNAVFLFNRMESYDVADARENGDVSDLHKLHHPSLYLHCSVNHRAQLWRPPQKVHYYNIQLQILRLFFLLLIPTVQRRADIDKGHRVSWLLLIVEGQRVQLRHTSSVGGAAVEWNDRSEPNKKCCIIGSLPSTSALYIFMSPVNTWSKSDGHKKDTSPVYWRNFSYSLYIWFALVGKYQSYLVPSFDGTYII